MELPSLDKEKQDLLLGLRSLSTSISSDIAEESYPGKEQALQSIKSRAEALANDSAIGIVELKEKMEKLQTEYNNLRQ